MLLMTHLTWLRQTVRAAPYGTMSKAEFLRAHWLVLTPYLSPAGLRALEEIQKRPPLARAQETADAR